MNKNKRDLLKIISVPVAAGTIWKKPVVDAVMLPAHAATTIYCTSCVSVDDDGFIFVPFDGNSQAGELYQYANNFCNGEGDLDGIVVSASSQAEAFSIYNSTAEIEENCASEDFMVRLEDEGNIPGYSGCNLWFCSGGAG